MWKTYSPIGAAALLVLVSLVFIIRQYLPSQTTARRREKLLWSLAKAIKEGRTITPIPRPNIVESNNFLRDLKSELRELSVYPIQPEVETDAYAYKSMTPNAEYVGCRVFVGKLADELELAGEVGDTATTAASLRDSIRDSYRSSIWGDPGEAMADLSRDVVRALRRLGKRAPDRELAVLIEAGTETLASTMGQWLQGLLKELLKEVHYPYLVVIADKRSQGGDQRSRTYDAWNTATDLLGQWLPGRDIDRFLKPVLKVTDSNLSLIEICCGVIGSAAESGELDQLEAAMNRLLRDHQRASLNPQLAAARAVRWAIDREASRLANATVTGAFDRLAVMGWLSEETFAGLMQGLELSESGLEELYTWLREQEYLPISWGKDPRPEIDSAKVKSSLDGAIVKAARDWLKKDEPSSYQDAEAAAERCFRMLVDLNRDPEGTPGYAGLDLYEDAGWQQNVYDWLGHAAQLSPGRLADTKIACICLFLEASWWWGDQIRLPMVGDLVKLYGEINWGRTDWLDHLAKFDRNYIPQLLDRENNVDRWQCVSAALASIAADLGLQPDHVPDDPMLKRIYVCWCFFRGDVAQYTGAPADADGWFRLAGEACDDDPDFTGVLAFAHYQRADVWSTADPGRCAGYLQEFGLAAEINDLEDRSLRAYLARMYGDMRWKAGDCAGAFDAYARAALHGYVYQVNQETSAMSLNQYGYALYAEIRTRLERRLTQAREIGLATAAGAAIERTRQLFRPYFDRVHETGREGAPPDAGLLADVIPPLPYEPGSEKAKQFNAVYQENAELMLEQMKEVLNEPVDQALEGAGTSNNVQSFH